MSVDRKGIFAYVAGLYERYSVDNISTSKKDQIGWKGAFIWKDNKVYPVIVKLWIPKKALRTVYDDKMNEKYSKHRCSHAKVLGFYSYYTGKEIKSVLKARSFHTGNEEYFLNSYSFPDNFSKAPAVCASGIHYFNTKESASIYVDNEQWLVYLGKVRRHAYLPYIGFI